MGDRDTVSRGGLLSKRRELYSRCKSRCKDQHYTKTAKHIKVYINGDNHFSVNEKQTPSLDTLLYDITKTIKPLFGAVRELYTPYGGTQIEDISELKMGGQYVAAGKGHLKPVDYSMIEVNRPRAIKKSYSHIKPVIHNKGYNTRAPMVRSRYAECMQKPVKTIFVYANGSPETCIKILLGGWQICNFNWILSEISSRVGFRMGCAVRRLHTLQGDVITSASQLENNTSYIACGTAKMKRMGYCPMSNNLTNNLANNLSPLSPRTLLKTMGGALRYDANSIMSEISNVPPQLAKDITLPPIRIKLPEHSEDFIRCHSRNSSDRLELSKKVRTIFSPRLHSRSSGRSQSRANSTMKNRYRDENRYYSEAPETIARTVADSDDVKIDEPVEVLSARSIASNRSVSKIDEPAEVLSARSIASIRSGGKITEPVEVLSARSIASYKSGGKINEPVEVLSARSIASNRSGGKIDEPVEVLSARSIASIKSGGKIDKPVEVLSARSISSNKSGGKINESVEVLSTRSIASIRSGGQIDEPVEVLSARSIASNRSGGKIDEPVEVLSARSIASNKSGGKIDEPVEVLSTRSISSDRSSGNAPTPSGAYVTQQSSYNPPPPSSVGSVTSSIHMPVKSARVSSRSVRTRSKLPQLRK